MNGIRHAMRIARRYAEGGSDDDEPMGGTPPGPQLGPHLGRVLEMQPLSPDQPSPSHNTMHTPYMPIPRGEPPPAPVIPKEEVQSAEKPAPQTAVQHWSQAIADHLVSRHGDDYPAAEEAIRDIGTNYSQRAADAVWSKMPLEHQMGMMDARMQDDLGPAAYRMATDPENWRVPPEKQEATQQEWNRVLAKPTTEQDRQEARGWLGELLRRNQAAQDEERVPVRTAPQQGASRSGYVSPYGIHSQQEEPEPELYGNEAYKEQLSQFEGEQPVGFDQVPRDQHPFNFMSRSSLEAYQNLLQPHFGDVNEFAKKFFGGYETRDINIDVNDYGYGPGAISFDGSLWDKGKHVADTSISIIPETNSAHLGLIEIDKNYRGTAGPILLRNQIDMYKQMGLDYVDLFAAGGGDPYGGSYAWLKYGFVPEQQEWDLMRQRFTQRLNNRTDLAPGDPAQKLILQNILRDPDPHAAWVLSDFTAPTVYGKPSGKQMLLSSSWSGQLNFKDTAAMERFDAYLKRPKKQSLDRSPND